MVSIQNSKSNEILPIDISNPENCIKLNISNYGIIVLNQKILHPKDFFVSFWNKATLRVTVDGGTNRWYNFIKEHNAEHCVVPVDIVSGDFDSISESSIQKAKKQGAQIINTHDQNETDFTKAVRVLSKYCAFKKIELKSIFVICQSSGRIDQIMANIDTLFKCFKLEMVDPRIAVHLFSHDSFTWLLQSGRHKICIPDSLKMSENAWCGLIPIGEKCGSVTTTGLKWNLNKNAMAFGSLISTSNTFDGSDCVNIENESPLLWCMGILPIFHDVCGTLDEEQ